MQVTVTLTGLDETQANLAKLSEGFKDFTNALNILGKQLIMFYGQTVFTTNGGALGKRWKALKPATMTYKDAHWPGRGILVRKGESGGMQSGFYSEARADSLFISNHTSYFPYHQLGTSEGRGRGHNIPARPMIGVNPRVELMIKKVLEEDIRSKIASL